MEKTILKTDGVVKSGNEVLAERMKNIITKDNMVLLALVIGTVSVAHNLISHGYGVDIETENKKVKVSFKPKQYYSQAV